MNNMCGIRILVLCFLALPFCSNSDNLALLLDNMKLIKRVVCNDEIVSLACPTGTFISIQVAQYGKAGEEHGCPTLSNEEIEVSGNCRISNVMQYTLLQRVVEACQKKPQCNFSTLPAAGGLDPCPRQSMNFKVSYRCRPYDFRRRTSCEGEVIELSCNAHSRIAIFDAKYGRTAYEDITCPQMQGVPEETCATPHAVKTVIQLCLGKRRCQIAANNRTFNSSCNYLSRPHLKVNYACVPLGVISEKYESAPERDENSTNLDHSIAHINKSDEAGEKWGEPTNGHTFQPSFEDHVSPKHDVPEEPQHGNSILLISFSVGLLMFIVIIGTVIAVRCYINRKKDHLKHGDMSTIEASKVFNDAFSDNGNDADIS